MSIFSRIPRGQKYRPGTRVWIQRDLGSGMQHFKSGCWAIVEFTYQQMYGRWTWSELQKLNKSSPIYNQILTAYMQNITKYCLYIPKHKTTSAWYNEHQLHRRKQE